MASRDSLVEFIFAPLTTFEWWKEDFLVGQYVPGCTYNCSRQEVHDELREKCIEWQAEGKIAIYPLAFGQNFVITKVGE